MELDEHQEWASELERHRGSKFVWVQFYFHHIGMVPLQVCPDLKWGTRVTSKGLCRSSPLTALHHLKTIASNTWPSYTLKATRMHIKFPPNDPSETRLIMNAKLRLPGSSHGPPHDLRKVMVGSQNSITASWPKGARKLHIQENNEKIRIKLAFPFWP